MSKYKTGGWAVVRAASHGASEVTHEVNSKVNSIATTSRDMIFTATTHLAPKALFEASFENPDIVRKHSNQPSLPCPSPSKLHSPDCSGRPGVASETLLQEPEHVETHPQPSVAQLPLLSARCLLLRHFCSLADKRVSLLYML